MIGYYVHHQGAGHLQRARCIAAQIDDDVVGVSSKPGPWPEFADWVTLPPDDTAASPTDVTAHRTLHWAPLRSRDVAARIAALTAWIARARPRAMVVDVSVEAVLATRLAGVPVVTVAMPGRRDDPAHQLGYSVADRILAFWSQAVYDPAWLHPHAAKVAYLGALSRFDARSRGRSPSSGPTPSSAGRRDVVVLSGAGGGGFSTATAAAARAATPDWRWRVLGAADWIADPWDALCGAGVVVTHGGQNAVAEVAAAGRPGIVIPQDRPFAEQDTTARALHAASIALREPAWPAPARWAGLLEAAAGIDPAGWRRWHHGDAARRAADVVTAVATTGPRLVTVRTAVVTVAAGRHAHLARQRAGLAAGSLAPDVHVVVSMGDQELVAKLAPTQVDVVSVAPTSARLPLAEARNAGAARAVELGADLLVFLDVDVVPGPALLARYVAAAAAHPHAVLSGPVAYLPAGVVDGFAAYPPHPARPNPPDGEVWPADDQDLFWSLSFALTPATWERIGGFFPGYRGYGGEDTDFARLAVRAGAPLHWVGGAHGYHQHHPVSNPPVEHLADILVNGRLFRDRWGTWPMAGWLAAFAERGLIRGDGDDWVSTAGGAQAF